MTRVCILSVAACPVVGRSGQLKLGEPCELEMLEGLVSQVLNSTDVWKNQRMALSFAETGPGTRQKLFSSYAAARLGLKNLTKLVESGTGGWAGGLAFDAAASEIARGRSKVALALGVWSETAIDTATSMDGAIRATGDIGYQTPSGATPLSWYAMDARKWLDDTCGTREDLAAIAVKNRNHAKLNPIAQYRSSLTASEVLCANPIVDPMGLLDVSARGDGAACLLLADEETARSSGLPYSVLTGSAFAHDGRFQMSGRVEPCFPYESLSTAADLALEQANATLKDIDLFELYAPMTVVEAICLETLGLAEPGCGGRLAAEGITALGGPMPVNVSGGLLSRGHPISVTALYDLIEIHLQLTNAAGERQVNGARAALHACETGKYNGAMVNIIQQGDY